LMLGYREFYPLRETPSTCPGLAKGRRRQVN
jgi:hypothetical protein